MSAEQLILVVGESTTGKSASLRNIKNQERWMYLNCESGKRLPFKNSFDTYTITDPYQVYEAFDVIQDNPAYDGIIIDTLTFLMDMFESMYIIGAANTMQGWSDYQQFFKNLMQDKVANSDKSVIFMAHTRAELNEKTMEMVSAVPVKGALKNNGLEAYFSTVVATKKIPVKKLEGADPKLLTVSPLEESVGYKHVFQTQITKETTGERIRSPMGMFDENQVYMDNDCELLLQHLNDYYH